MKTPIAVRPLRSADIRALSGVLTRAYESKQNFSWRLSMYLEMHDVATFVADIGGEPVGMVVGNDYGTLAYVSQMAVDPPVQRRGIATALMDALIAWTAARGFAAVELDATPPGAPLYARYGFAQTSRTLVYFATHTSGGSSRLVRAGLPADRAAICAADALAFGADRSDVLHVLLDAAPGDAFVTASSGAAGGFAVAQRAAEQLGPVIAPDPVSAAALIDAARAVLPGTHRISVPSDNAAVQSILAARGYRFSRSLAHMLRGAAPAGARDRLYARINLGQG
jgi:GNAT superfamily N-acetyltransferase